MRAAYQFHVPVIGDHRQAADAQPRRHPGGGPRIHLRQRDGKAFTGAGQQRHGGEEGQAAV